MSENLDIEYKEIWKDEYLKWICGFANSKSGTLYIGINDNGKIVGIDNAKILVEEIPNKVKNILGIIVDTKIEKENKLEYICIKVEEYPSPISYKRLRKEDLEIDNETLLRNLNLYDGKYLTRAAILLFAEKPEKWIVGAYI